MGVNGIYGLSGSGLDIESMVKVGMMGQQKQLDKLQQKTDLATWKKESMSSVYSDLSTYNYSTLTQYKLQSNMNAMSATSSDESVVKVTANGSAASMSHKVSVGRLSSNAYLITADKIKRENPSAGTSIYMADSLFSDGGQTGKVYTVDGTDYVSYKKGDTVTSSVFVNTAANQRTFGYAAVTVTRTETADGTVSNTWSPENFDDIRITQDHINSLMGLEAGSGSYRINGRIFDYSGRTDTTTTSFSFTDANGATTNPPLQFTKNADGTYKYGNTDNIAEDLSTLATSDKIVMGGKIVNGSDIAVSFTLMDGAESETLAGMTADEIKEKRTISYTYAELAAGGKTYNDLAADINALGTNVKASYDAANDSFSLTNKNSGKDNKISLTMNTELAATLFNNLGLKQSKDGALLGQKTGENAYSDTTYQFTSGGETSLAGDSGKITIDGKTYDNVEDNRITVDGVTYNLQNVSSSAESSTKYTMVDENGNTIGALQEAGGAKTVNVVINQNTDAIIDKVKSFVEDYNKLLDGLYEKYSETKYSDYKPLTESQRDKMTEKQIEKWEEKAKSGLLYHDRTIGSIIDKLRTALATPVDGLDSKYNSAYSIGIYTSKTNGHISLDEDRLKKALAEDPEAAYNVFGTLPNEDKLKASISNEKGEYDKSRLSQMMYDGMGVAQRLGDVMSQAMKSVKTEAGASSEVSDGSNLGNKILEFQQKMSDFKTLMSAFESRLFKKYDAMESLLATLGAQMNYITGGQ